MPIRPEFAARVAKFFDTHGHHYQKPNSAAMAQAATPPQTPPGVKPTVDVGAPQEAIAPTTHYDGASSDHHSNFQPRDTGKFAGPPAKQWYKMQEQSE
jgi:hypothetical protein